MPCNLVLFLSSISLLRKSLRVLKTFVNDPFDLTIHTAEFIIRPFFDLLEKLRIDAQHKGFAFAQTYQEFNVPALTTGTASLSPQRTTIRLLTMEAFLSSSNSMIRTCSRSDLESPERPDRRISSIVRCRALLISQP